MRVIIAGGGRTGSALADVLTKEGHEIVLIESDEARAEKLAEKLDALVLHGDATEKDILKGADIDKCDGVIALTADDKANLLICEAALESGVKKTVSRLNDPANRPLFRREGISFLIDTTASAVAEFRKALEKEGVQTLCILGAREEVIELYVDPGCKIAGMTAGSLLKDKIVVVSIERGGKPVLPKPDAEVRGKDVVVVCVPVGSRKKLESLLSPGGKR
jgi:trk system potassium uptake protein TrkA